MSTHPAYCQMGRILSEGSAFAIRSIFKSAVTSTRSLSRAWAHIHRSFSSTWSVCPVALSTQFSSQRGRSRRNTLRRYFLASVDFMSAYSSAVCRVTSSRACRFAASTMAARLGAALPVSCSNNLRPKEISARVTTETYLGESWSSAATAAVAATCFACDGSNSADIAVVSRR